MKNKDNIILGIESSCDDTSAAIIINGYIKSNVVANQDIHSIYGGVVPELASRAHQQKIVPVIDLAIRKAQIKKEDISAIAFTYGPGLLGSLLVGVSFAKSFALALNIPIITVNHLQAHLLSHFIKTEHNEKKHPEFPFICLTVSGGHTQIILLEDYLKTKILGQSVDDAAGEAFDKAAKILGLDYPGGPLIDKYAKNGDKSKFKFTFPKVKDLDYSFSGLKTQFLYFIQNETKINPNFITENLEDICASYQNHIISYLFKNLKKALEKTGCKNIAIAGGVSANSELRKQLIKFGNDYDCNIFIPEQEYCTDNAAMIAQVGYYLFKEKQFASQSVSAVARVSW